MRRISDGGRWGGIVGLLGLVVLSGCGVKSPPQPPVIRVADTTRDLAVFQDDREAVLDWSYPSSTTSGESLHDLESVQIWRATFLEVEAPPPGEKPAERDLNRQLLLSGGELVADLGREELDAATRGSKLEWRDDLERWRSEHPSDESQILWYAVRTLCCRGRESSLSNIARLVPEPPPAPPTGFAAVAEADGIRLTWTGHDDAPVVVERSAGDDVWRQVTANPLDRGEWLDRSAAQQQGWSYRLRSVKQRENGPRIVGEPGPPVEIYYPDIYPPADPADLVCLPEGTRVRLRWRAVPEAATYRVYRGTDGVPPSVLEDDLGDPQFVDLAPPPGMSIYEVTAVDAAGNESGAVSCTAARGASR